MQCDFKQNIINALKIRARVQMFECIWYISICSDIDVTTYSNHYCGLFKLVLSTSAASNSELWIVS